MRPVPILPVLVRQILQEGTGILQVQYLEAKSLHNLFVQNCEINKKYLDKFLASTHNLNHG